MPKNIQKNRKVYKNSKKIKKIEDNINQIESLETFLYSLPETLENDNESSDNLSIEELLKKEFKNIIRICDICGNEMNLDIDSENFEIFVCNNCGYKIRLNNNIYQK
ncbi:MAG: hypothetical protein ACP5RD_04255 [bacterium]|jgi:DNA-directed RNA polymerase subunit RPC12/RpoP